MKEIRINSKKHGKKVVFVDDEDYKFLKQFNWHVIKCCNTFYAIVDAPQKKGVKRATIRMHRLILGLNDPKIMTDHIDHNGLNNQKINLRKSTNSQNLRNRLPDRNSSSKYLGVSWDKKRNRWQMQIKGNGFKKYSKRFNKETDAALAYNKKAAEIYGEFACLNSI